MEPYKAIIMRTPFPYSQQGPEHPEKYVFQDTQKMATKRLAGKETCKKIATV